MGMKEYVLWGGGLLVVLVVAHGLWQALRSRRRRNAARAEIEPDADSGAAQMDIFEPPVLSDVDETVDAPAGVDTTGADSTGQSAARQPAMPRLRGPPMLTLRPGRAKGSPLAWKTRRS